MDRTILVPVDGSPLAERALPYAHVFARAAGARLLLVRAIPIQRQADPGDAEARATRQSAEAYRRELASQQPDAEQVVTVVALGEAADALVDEIGVRQPDLVVMSTHGRSGIGRWVYGSVADAVLRQADAPVLLVPAACPIAWPRDRTPRILVPLDGSELAERALGLVDPWARALHAEIFVLRVVEPRSMAATDPSAFLWLDPTAEIEEAHAYVQGMVKKLQADGFAARGADAFGFAVPTIVDTARAESADLVAMSTHGRGGLTRLLMGSVATGVVQRMCAPMLLARPAEVRREEAAPAAARYALRDKESGDPGSSAGG
jgi:nucleotide-binding universal stress UspA family protein